MGKIYICSVCKKEFYTNYHYLDDGYICDDCLNSYEDKFYMMFGIDVTTLGKYDVSLPISNFITFLGRIKEDFNGGRYYISLKGVRDDG